MPLRPVFEIGVANAWALVLPLILVNYPLSYSIVDKKAGLFVWPHYDRGEKVVLVVMMAALVVFWAYSIFLPLRLGVAWFFVGFPISLMGLAFTTLGVVGFARSPTDQPVTRGIFRISRNPMYFGWFLVHIGIGIACASWLYLLMAAGLVASMHILVGPEERICLEKYGDAYREYMKRVPRWIGLRK